ncbi:MAG: carbohydrate kinase [Rhodobacteraceae bacterium]|nr:carbohydrate kinase [Paracoccaceae bacterium]
MPSQSENLFLGIDAGSSVLKAAVFDCHGEMLAVASRRTPLNRPQPGWVEVDPEQSLDALDAVIAEVAAATGQPENIKGIGLSGAMVGAWFVDGAGGALRPGINWEDSRSQSLLDAMTAERPSLMSDIFAVSGSVPQQGCTLPILAWFQQNDPEILQRTAHVLTYKDFLRHHLSGSFCGDHSEAAVMPGDARIQGHSPDLMRLFGIADLESLFPPTLASDEIAGHLLPGAAARSGIRAGTPIVAGAGDVIANVIGAGGLRNGAATAILGTTCMVGICHSTPQFVPPDLGLLFSLPGNYWYRAMVNVAGTLNLDWALELLAPELKDDPRRFARIDAMVDGVPPGAHGVTFLPYLSESGIIAPVVDAGARAQFTGLHRGHDKADLLRAVYEGVAFAIGDLLELLQIRQNTEIVLTGGGSRSAIWVQIIANVTGRTIIVPENAEFGARGAALLAATALGHFPSITSASQAMAVGNLCTKPKPEEEDLWERPRIRYRQFRDHLLR